MQPDVLIFQKISTWEFAKFQARVLIKSSYKKRFKPNPATLIYNFLFQNQEQIWFLTQVKSRKL